MVYFMLPLFLRPFMQKPSQESGFYSLQLSFTATWVVAFGWAEAGNYQETLMMPD